MKDNKALARQLPTVLEVLLSLAFCRLFSDAFYIEKVDNDSEYQQTNADQKCYHLEGYHAVEQSAEECCYRLVDVRVHDDEGVEVVYLFQIKRGYQQSCGTDHESCSEPVGKVSRVLYVSDYNAEQEEYCCRSRT